MLESGLRAFVSGSVRMPMIYCRALFRSPELHSSKDNRDRLTFFLAVTIHRLMTARTQIRIE